MAQILTNENEEIQFVFNESDFVLNPSDNTEELNNVILSDGSRAILVNGHILQTEPHTVLLQDVDNIDQYFINNDNGELLIADQDNTHEIQNNDANIIHYMDEDGNITTEPPNILYVDENGVPIREEDLSDYKMANSIESGDTQDYHTQILDHDQLLQQGGTVGLLENLVDQNEYQYAILKDGKLHIQSYKDVRPETSDFENSNEPLIDVSSIKGTNLLTGQTVSLQSYIERLHTKNDIASPDSLSVEKSFNRKRKLNKDLKGLLNMKLNLGKTSSGKRLVGKVVHVESKKPAVTKENYKKSLSWCKNLTDSKNESSSGSHKEISPRYKYRTYSKNDSLGGQNEISPQYENRTCSKNRSSGDYIEIDGHVLTESASKVVPVNDDHSMYSRTVESEEDPPPSQFNVVSLDSACFHQITETLTGLMGTDNLKTKLLEKTLMISVVEKNYQLSKPHSKNISYCSGHMEAETGYDEYGNFVENWSFIPYSQTEELFQSKSFQDKKMNSSICKYEDVTNLTLIITFQKNKRLIRVIIDPEYQCSQCHKEFQNNRKLRDHMENVHFKCTNCGVSFDSLQVVREHKLEHSANKGKLYLCMVNDCQQSFRDRDSLSKHTETHESEAPDKQSTETHSQSELIVKQQSYNCTICGKLFSSIRDLNFHKNTHHMSRLYGCDICKRAFSRYANLQRHAEIHKGSAEMYSCDICGCSYHYMSSLTRHVVNNHIKTLQADKIVVREAD